MAFFKNSTILISLLAGTALVPVTVYAQDQPAGGTTEELMQNPDASAQGQADQASPEELPTQNQATSPDGASPDATQDQADTQQPDELKQDQNQAASPDGATEDQNQSTAGNQDEETIRQKDAAGKQTDEQMKEDDTARSQDQEDRDGQKAAGTRSEDEMKKEDTAGTGKKDNEDQAASQKPSMETTGSIDISAEQKTVIRNTIVNANVAPVDVDFEVSVGVTVPKKVKLLPLPAEVVEIVPAYRDYVYFVLADGRIVIVEPSSYEIVYILAV